MVGNVYDNKDAEDKHCLKDEEEESLVREEDNAWYDKGEYVKKVVLTEKSLLRFFPGNASSQT